ncbi:hypothetical protein GFM14_28600 [Rhizobium leguminosarum bv. viciae]|nr:hypothetical protein [Rhizobium leguminosarum bv. viciae]
MIRSIADHEPHLMSFALAADITARRTGSKPQAAWLLRAPHLLMAQHPTHRSEPDLNPTVQERSWYGWSPIWRGSYAEKSHSWTGGWRADGFCDPRHSDRRSAPQRF